MIQPGYYDGKIIGYGMRETRNGALSPTIKFQVKDHEGKLTSVFWQKNFATAKLVDQVLKELVTCGLKDVQDFAYIADGLESNVLDTERFLNLTVEHETYEGKTYPKVAWINEPKDPNAKDEKGISREKAQAMLETLDITDAFERAFAAANKGKEPTSPF